MKKILALCLLFALACQLAACGAATETQSPTSEALQTLPSGEAQVIQAVSLMEPYFKESPSLLTADDGNRTALLMAQLATALLRQDYDPAKNTVFSPYSILQTLGMLSLGAEGQTLGQMEALLGTDRETLGSLLYLAQEAQRPELCNANSLWLRHDLQQPVRESFLQQNGCYYDAHIYTADFDGAAADQMNAWVKEHTAGRIEQMVQQLRPEDRLVLLSALQFDARWESPYEEKQVTEGIFHCADGTQQNATMLSGTEQFWLEDELSTGFIKDYENGYRFVALLPKEGVSMEDYLASLQAESFCALIENASKEQVRTLMPKLCLEEELDLAALLTALGMTDAFTMSADLSGISQEELYVSQMRHKLSLQVDEAGTQAGAATSAVIAQKGGPMTKQVFLDRPYVMAIVDGHSGSLLFFGVINSAA